MIAIGGGGRNDNNDKDGGATIAIGVPCRGSLIRDAAILVLVSSVVAGGK